MQGFMPERSFTDDHHVVDMHIESVLRFARPSGTRSKEPTQPKAARNAAAQVS
jgi:hypothetical protein